MRDIPKNLLCLTAALGYNAQVKKYSRRGIMKKLLLILLPIASSMLNWCMHDMIRVSLKELSNAHSWSCKITKTPLSNLCNDEKRHLNNEKKCCRAICDKENCDSKKDNPIKCATISSLRATLAKHANRYHDDEDSMYHIASIMPCYKITFPNCPGYVFYTHEAKNKASINKALRIHQKDHGKTCPHQDPIFTLLGFHEIPLDALHEEKIIGKKRGRPHKAQQEHVIEDDRHNSIALFTLGQCIEAGITIINFNHEKKMITVKLGGESDQKLQTALNSADQEEKIMGKTSEEIITFSMTLQDYFMLGAQTISIKDVGDSFEILITPHNDKKTFYANIINHAAGMITHQKR